MFDYYKPKEKLTCPTCGNNLNEWQGKDGPCALFLWEQGTKFPTDQKASAECRLPEKDRKKFHLPDKFEIYSYDCPNHQPIVATCISKSNVWEATELNK